LQDTTGLMLARPARARVFPHRRHTPVIMFSSGTHQAEARRAGAGQFLKMPEDIDAVGKTVALLLTASRGHA
jgi:hypothetical protein